MQVHAGSGRSTHSVQQVADPFRSTADRKLMFVLLVVASRPLKLASGL